MLVDDVVNRLARSQYGAFGRHQLLAAGVDRSAIDRRLRAGRWIRLDAGVYALPSHPRTWLQRAVAATLGQTDGVLSGRSGAALLGIGDAERRGPIELTVPRHVGRRSALARVRRSLLLEPRVIHQIPVNSPALLVVELAARLDVTRTGQLLDDAVRDGWCRVDHVGEWLVRITGRRVAGTATLRAALTERGEGFVPSESVLEAHAFDMLDAPGIPPVIRQARFPWRPTLPHRVDGLVDGWPLIVEADGRAWHSRLEQMESDRRRDRDALAHGYLTARYSWLDVTERREACRDEVRAIGARWCPPETAGPTVSETVRDDPPR